jgi:hypothetical protein
MFYPVSTSITLHDKKQSLDGWGLQGSFYVRTSGILRTTGIFRMNRMTADLAIWGFGVGFFEAKGRMEVIGRPHVEVCSCEEN